jgi:tRNA(Arg) A34 adenosine deaminase TadA
MFYVRHHEYVKCQLLADIFLVEQLEPCHLCLSACYA